MPGKCSNGNLSDSIYANEMDIIDKGNGTLENVTNISLLPESLQNFLSDERKFCQLSGNKLMLVTFSNMIDQAFVLFYRLKIQFEHFSNYSVYY